VGDMISRKVYRALLLLYPEDFRREFGDEMLSMLEECSAMQGYCLVFADALRSAAKQHLSHHWTIRSRTAFAYSDIGCAPYLPQGLAIAALVVGLIAGALGHGGESRNADSWATAPAEVRFWFPTGIVVVERKSHVPDAWRVLRIERSFGK
jgi:uncharacterized membrane protein YtjA (UPF0391 family)